MCRHLPEVLAVRVKIFDAVKKWDLMEVVAKKLVEYQSENVEWWILWAQATSHAEFIEGGNGLAKPLVREKIAKNDSCSP